MESRDVETLVLVEQPSSSKLFGQFEKKASVYLRNLPGTLEKIHGDGYRTVVLVEETPEFNRHLGIFYGVWASKNVNSDQGICF